MRLKGRVAVVTGGTRGLGAYIAVAFAAEGCQVVRASRHAPAATSAGAGDAGDRSVFARVDVTQPDSVRDLMRWTADTFGGLDVVVANAGVSRPGRVASLPAEQWSEVVTTNLTGVFHCVQAAVPYLEKSKAGRLINLSSALATRVAPGASAYCSSKAAVEMFTRVCAVELAPSGITVNCLSPGLIDEGMGRQLAANEAVWSLYEPKLASGRLGRPEEVADAAVFLASDESSYVNGHVLEVNGGLNW